MQILYLNKDMEEVLEEQVAPAIRAVAPVPPQAIPRVMVLLQMDQRGAGRLNPDISQNLDHPT